MANAGAITRSMISVGSEVEVNPKSDRSREKLVPGLVTEILTGSESHPHGIMVKLDNGEIGRVKSLSGRALEKIDPDRASEEEGHKAIDLTVLPHIDEGPFLEFKSSALWSKFYTKEDIQKANGDVKRYGQDTSKLVIAKTVTSFLNTDGGILVIGIKENKSTNANETIGIESEYKKLKDQCEDGYRRMILDLIIKPYLPSFVFNEFNKYLKIEFIDIEGKKVCVIHANKSDKQVFLSIKKEELFYIRVDASSRMIEGQDLVNYCMGRFSVI